MSLGLLEKYAIRKAMKEDCKSIYKLLLELNDYQTSPLENIADDKKCPDGPSFTVEILERDGFGTHPCFEAFVAHTSDTKEIVGLATYFYTYSTWEGKSLYMDDIYVQKQHRRKGVGFFLFRAVAQAALERNCARFNFSVLGWNSPSIKFYKSLGAVDVTEKEGWHSFRLDRPKMEQLTITKST